MQREREGEAVVIFKLVFAQEHKGQSVRQFYRCERGGLDTRETTSWNTQINSRGGFGCLYRICGRRYGIGPCEWSFFFRNKKLLDTRNHKDKQMNWPTAR